MKRSIWFFALFLSSCSSGIGDRCEDNENCPEGQYCARVAVCTKSCAGDGTCPEGSACRTIEGRAVCLRSCTENDDCNDTEACEDSVCRIQNPLEPF